MGHVECSTFGCNNRVFSGGICRKHYEQERLATASPCSFPKCKAPSYRGTLCAVHYRQHIKQLRPTCTVPGCTGKQKTLTSKLCDKHLFRAKKHGSLNQPRRFDWGAREKHPNYGIWIWHRRKGKPNLHNEWYEDFWAFVNAVGIKPANHTLRRLDASKPLGPNNWSWVESISNHDKARYQREWRKRNPEKATNNFLKKSFGITLATYEELALRQNWLCAICGEPERSKDKDGAPRRMPVDHCHKTGKIRGLLCSSCNRGLGLFKDQPEILNKAIAYLNNHLDSSVNS